MGHFPWLLRWVLLAEPLPRLVSDVEDEVLARSVLGSWLSGISLYQAAAPFTHVCTADTGRLIRTACAGRRGRGLPLTYPLRDDCWDLIPLSFKGEISSWELEEVQRSSLGCRSCSFEFG